jgi:hypothetical protein
LKIKEYCSRCDRLRKPHFATPDGKSTAELDAAFGWSDGSPADTPQQPLDGRIDTQTFLHQRNIAYRIKSSPYKRRPAKSHESCDYPSMMLSMYSSDCHPLIRCVAAMSKPARRAAGNEPALPSRAERRDRSRQGGQTRFHAARGSVLT